MLNEEIIKKLIVHIENTSEESIGIKYSFENGRIIIDFGDRYDFQDFIKESLEGTKNLIMLNPGSQLNAEYKRVYKKEIWWVTFFFVVDIINNINKVYNQKGKK